MFKMLCSARLSLALMLIAGGTLYAEEKTLPEWIKALDDGDAKLRRQAADALRLLGSKAKDALPALAAASKDKDAKVRIKALGAIATIGPDAGTEPALIAALKDNDARIRALAASAMGWLKPASKDSVSALVDALADPDASIRFMAGEALGRLGPAAKDALPALAKAFKANSISPPRSAELTDALDAIFPFRVRPLLGSRPGTFAWALSQLGPAGLEALGELMKEKDALRRIAAARLLINDDQRWEAALQVLLEAVDDPDSDVSLQALEGIVASKRIIAALGNELQSPKEQQRRRAARALAYRGDRVTLAALTKELTEATKDESVFVRIHAANAIWRIDGKGEAYLTILAEAMTNKDPEARVQAVTLLGSMAFFAALREQAEAKLADALRDDHAGVRVRAADGLVRYDFRTGVAAAPDPRVLDVFVTALSDKQEGNRRVAVAALARLGKNAETALKPLGAALKDENAFVRRHAADALSRIGAQESVPAVTEALQDSAAEVRQLAAEALGVIGPPAEKAVPALTKTLEDDNRQVRLAAAEALGRIGPASNSAVPRLIAMLDGKEVPESGLVGRFGLVPPRDRPRGFFGNPAGVPRYYPSESDYGVVLTALAGIGPQARAAVPLLVRILSDKDGAAEIRNLACVALGSIGPEAKDAVPVLISLLDNWRHEASATSALVRIGKPAVSALTTGLKKHGLASWAVALGSIGEEAEEAVPALASALKTPNTTLCAQAAFALGRIGPKARSAVPGLIELLSDQTADIQERELAAQAIGDIGPDAAQAVPALIDALEDKAGSIRHRAAHALGRIGAEAAKAIPALKKLRKDEHPQPRRAAEMALRRLEKKPISAAELPKEYQATVDKGLAYLAHTQHADGHWEANAGGYPASMTALAGLALMMEGSSTTEGKYSGNIRKATDWFIKRSQRDGLLGDPDNAAESSRYLFGHGYGILFLSCVCEQEENQARRRQLQDVLNRAIRFTARAQTSKGGWGYVSGYDGGNFDEGTVTVIQIQSLRAARHAGIPVPRQPLARALAYLKKSTDERGGLIYSQSAEKAGEGRPPLTAAAIACSHGPQDYDTPLVKSWFRFCVAKVPVGGLARLGHDEFTHFYFAQAVYALGDEGYAKLFPDSKPNERLTWSAYKKKMFDQLRLTQGADGSWTGRYVGPVYATATSLGILQLDREALPFYQR